jgi:hypothetical protein
MGGRLGAKREMSYRVFISSFCLAIVAHPAGAQKPRSSNLDLVAPIGRQSLVDIGGPGITGATVKADGFQGEAVIKLDDKTGRGVLVVVPKAGSTPTDLIVSRNKKQTVAVHVFPVPHISDTETSLESIATAPDPAGRDYTVLSQRKEAFGALFNGQTRDSLRHIRLSGYRIVLVPGDVQGSYERLMPGGSAPQDVASLEIYAREIVIGAPILLPCAKVTIYTQKLRFVDKGDVASAIITTPAKMLAKTTAGEPGLDGQAAGEIVLQVSSIEKGTLTAPRFVTTGGEGQRGGPETPGQAGTTLPQLAHEPQIGGIVRSWHNINKDIHGTLPTRWEPEHYHAPKYVVWFTREGRVEWGARDVWPDSGGHGISGGRPGNGGDAGNIHTSVDLTPDMFAAEGGISGEPRPAAPGGAAGQPSPSVGIAIESEVRKYGSMKVRVPIYRFYVHESKPGKEGPSLQPVRAKGNDGTVLKDRSGWLHPLAAQTMLSYAEDLYRLGFLTRASEQLRFLEESLFQSTAPQDPMFIQVKQRLTALQSRLASNLDYFGNPGGWVPSLDFPVLFAALRNEVQASAPILLVTEQIRVSAEEGKAKKAGLVGSRDAGATRAKDLETRLNALAIQLPMLQTKAAQVAADEDKFVTAIRQREVQLGNTAQDLANPRTSFLKSALKTIAAVAKVIPVGQPIVGGVGAALDLASGIDERTPWETINQLPSVASQFSRDNLNQSLGSYKQLVGDINALNPANPKQLFNDISSAANTVGNTLAEFRRQQEQMRAPASAVDAILQKLKAEDPSLNQFIDQASRLSAEKKVLSEQIDRTSHEIGDLTSELTRLAAMLDALNQQITSAQDYVDHPAIVSAAAMGQALRERLDYYHYLVIKAYEYYSAEPYRGDYRVAGTAESLLSFLRNQGGDVNRAVAAYVAAYQNAIQSVAGNIIRQLASGVAPRQVTVTIPLSRDEDARVERMANGTAGTVPDLFIDLNTAALIPTTHLEARLQKVEVQCKCELKSHSGVGTIHMDVFTGPNGIIRAADKTVEFRQATVSWPATVDLSGANATIRQGTLPPDIGAILTTLLGMPALPSYSTAPPVLPGVYFRARSLGAAPPAVEVDNVRLRVTYSYKPVFNGRGVQITTRSETGITPFYYVTAADGTGAQHGFGTFTRIFAPGQEVHIIAPTLLGQERFEGWYARGRRVGRSNRLTLPAANDSYLFEARFEK